MHRLIASAAPFFCLLTLAGALAAKDEEVFDPAPVLRLKIELSREARHALQSNGKAYVRGTVWEGETAYRDVGIHLKGSAGSYRDLNDRPGLTLKFNRYVPSQRFHGLKKLLLNNAAQDPTFLSECIGNELFRAAGVPAQRIGFARLNLNGRDMGLYLACEAVTRDFLRRWFTDASGNLYEGPGDVNNFDGLDVDSHKGKSDRADLRALVEAASQSSGTKRLEALERVLDLPRFFSFLAMEVVTVHWDGYAQGVNNYHTYHNPQTGRFVFILHGADQLFQNPGAPPLPQTNGLIARQVMGTTWGKRRYRERLNALLDTVLEPKAIEKRIDGLVQKLRPLFEEFDHNLARNQASQARGLAARIADRVRFLREQVAGPALAVAPPLRFDERGMARPGGWQQRAKSGQPTFQRTAEGEGPPALKILAGQGDTAGSWRTKVGLSPGRYRLVGRVRTEGVEPAGNVRAGLPSGAGIRISGEQPPGKLIGSHGWTSLEFAFQVPAESEDEDAATEVELVCELQASKGEAWFEESSLVLIRDGGEAVEPSSSR